MSHFFLGNFFHTFFSEIFRPCAMYIRQPPSFFFFAFDFFDYGFSPKMIITTLQSSKLLLLLLRGGGGGGN